MSDSTGKSARVRRLKIFPLPKANASASRSGFGREKCRSCCMFQCFWSPSRSWRRTNALSVEYVSVFVASSTSASGITVSFIFPRSSLWNGSKPSWLPLLFRFFFHLAAELGRQSIVSKISRLKSFGFSYFEDCFLTKTIVVWWSADPEDYKLRRYLRVEDCVYIPK